MLKVKFKLKKCVKLVAGTLWRASKIEERALASVAQWWNIGSHTEGLRVQFKLDYNFRMVNEICMVITKKIAIDYTQKEIRSEFKYFTTKKHKTQ